MIIQIITVFSSFVYYEIAASPHLASADCKLMLWLLARTVDKANAEHKAKTVHDVKENRDDTALISRALF